MLMLPTRIHRLQSELHQHHRWLNLFLQRARIESRTLPLLARETWQRRSYAAKHNRGRDVRGAGSKQPSTSKLPGTSVRSGPKRGQFSSDVNPSANPVIQALRQAIEGLDSRGIIDNYSALNDRDKSTLTKYDVRALAQSLHQIFRRAHGKMANATALFQRELLQAADKVVEDIKDGKLVPNGRAQVHLIGLYKEAGMREKGIQFWRWLHAQEVPYVDVDVYGAAIELLAVEGTSLAELEGLYDEALSRFPGNFAAYHLDPNAVLPDREQPFTVGATPVTLLQGILTGRLLNGDSKNAYLALDTAIRLLPDQVPTRMCSIFLEERPLQEAFAVFAMAARAGPSITGAYYRAMLQALRLSSDLSSPARHGLALRGMLSATYLYKGAGGSVANNSLNELVVAISLFMRIKGVSALGTQQKQHLGQALFGVIRSVISIFKRYEAHPTTPAFNSIITNLGGFGHSREAIGLALAEVVKLGLASTDVTWRSMLSAAGMIQDKGLVEQSWTSLTEQTIAAGQNPTVRDFHALVKPAHNSGALQFASEQLDKFRDVLQPVEYEGVAARLENLQEMEMHSVDDVEPADLAAIFAELGKIKADINFLDEKTRNNAYIQDFSSQTLPLTLTSPQTKLSLPESATWQIYDELTANPSAPKTTSYDFDATAQPGPPSMLKVSNTVSRTSIPLSTLRYENWKMFNYLLEQSEATDKEYMRRVDSAIVQGKVPPKRTLAPVGDGGVSWGLSDLADAGSGVKEASAERVEEVRKEILRLRGRSAKFYM